MPITTLELAKRIQNTHDDWVSVNGMYTESAVNSGIEPFWQFRVAIKPTRENAIKAMKALAVLPQFIAEDHLEFKVFLPAEASDLHTWDGTVSCGDRDQRGKEICVYMTHLMGRIKPEYYNGNYPSQDYLKKLVLDMWKALQDAGVEMAYITPGVGEKELPCDDSMLTPFSYSSFKPYKQRYGILNEKDYNPTLQQDPLAEVTVTEIDLKNHGIHPMGALKSAQRLIYQTEHHARQTKKMRVVIDQLLAQDKTTLDSVVTNVKRYQAYLSSNNSLQKISKELFIESSDHLKITLIEYCSSLEPILDQLTLPSEFTLTNKIFATNFELLKSLANESDLSNTNIINKYSALIPASILSKLDDSMPFYNRVAYELFDDLNLRLHAECNLCVDEMTAAIIDGKFSVQLINKLIGIYPHKFQEIYQQIIHLNNEDAAIAKEARRYTTLFKPQVHPASYTSMCRHTSSLENARELLNDYTKANSVVSRLIHGHWNRNHVDEVNAIVKDIDNREIKDMFELSARLASIPLHNPKGSLARRIEFIIMPFAQSIARPYKLRDELVNTIIRRENIKIDAASLISRTDMTIASNLTLIKDKDNAIVKPANIQFDTMGLLGRVDMTTGINLTPRRDILAFASLNKFSKENASIVDVKSYTERDRQLLDKPSDDVLRQHP